MTTVLPEIRERLAAMPLVDHHVHSIHKPPLTRDMIRNTITEADRAHDEDAAFDSQLGFAVRGLCAPLMDLPPFASADDYMGARERLGFEESTRRLLQPSGITHYLVDGGYQPEALLSEEEFAELAQARVHSILRLETLAEEVMASSDSATEFVERLRAALDSSLGSVIGYKTVAAYRSGLALDPGKPTGAEVLAASERWRAGGDGTAIPRLTDPVIVRHLIWWALEAGQVLQVHAGFGGSNLTLATADPALMQPLAAATQSTGGRIVLLHCYPYVREAGFLAHLYPHVYLDTGLTVPYIGSNATSAIRESLDLAPFTKVLFSSDAWGLPEIVYLGARMWRDAMGAVLTDYVTHHSWPVDEAIRIAELIAWRNAEAVYRTSFSHE